MEFGRIDTSELNNINFDLPTDHPQTLNILKKQRKSITKLYIGCAKWGRKDWVGKIYPKGTKDSDFLEHYAKHFNCIELNATFYKLPDKTTVERWKSKVDNDFMFCPKFTDLITHKKRLKDCEQITNQFLEGITHFGDHLGPSFLQLPPNFGPKNYDVLISFMKSIPEDLKLFLELRHSDWFKDPYFEQITEYLESQDIGFVITDAAGRRDCLHTRLTTPQAFVRFVGNSLHATDYKRIDAWTDKMKNWVNKGLDELYFFMHQHDELYSPELILYQIKKMNEILNTKIPVPAYHIPPKQMGMF